MKKLFVALLLVLSFCIPGFCADRYFVNGGVDNNWSTSGNWSNTSGGAGGAGVPTSSDAVYFDANSPDCVLDATGYCLSLDFTGYTNEFTHVWNSDLEVYSDLTMSSGMTYTPQGFSDILMKGNGNVTTAGQTLGAFHVAASGCTVTLQDDLTVGSEREIYLDQGTFDTNGKTVTCYEFYGTASGTRVLTCGASTINITDEFYFISGTLNAGTSNFVFTVNGTLKCLFNITGSFYDMTINGSASKTNVFQFQSGCTISNDLIISGNSATNRVLVSSYTLGSPSTVTVNNSVSVSNADFQDITGAGSASWDLSAITGGSGDCGGNTGITFTTADDWYWHVDGGNISDYSHWYTATNGGGSQMASTRVPLPQDTLYFDASSFDSGSQTITTDLVRLGSVDWTGTTNSPRWDIDDQDTSFYGNFTLISGMTFDPYYKRLYFEGRGSHTLTSAGNSFYLVDIQGVGGAYTLQDAWQSSTLRHYAGTLDFNDFNVTNTQFYSSGTRTLNCGSGTWTSTYNSSGDIWNVGVSGLTFNAETSEIVWSSVGGNIRIYFSSDGLTFNNVTIQGNPNYFQLEQGHTFNTLTISPRTDSTTQTIKFLDGNTTTVSSFVAVGNASNTITLTGTSTGGWTISDSSGTNQVYYCTISYSTATGGATWKASTSDGNTDGGNNSGWDFSATGGVLSGISGIERGIESGIEGGIE